MVDKQRGIGWLWHSFLYEVNRATASLMYLLQGMESVRSSELLPYNKLPPDQQKCSACFPKLSYVDIPLSLSGIGFDYNDILKHEGEAEQLAFKGWVEQVYFLWESQFRNELKGNLEGSDIILPESDSIGDFRLVRNDLIHNNGVASEDNSGKCTVLKWYDPGERIILGMNHVFDFLNHMGFMTTTPGYLDHGPFAAWTIFPGMEDSLGDRPVPRIVSLRTSIDKELDDGSSRHVISVVFENGVFVNVPVHYAASGHPLRERIEFIDNTHIDEDGNLRFANGVVKYRVSLYREAVDALFKKGPKIEGIGVPGPAFRFRR